MRYAPVMTRILFFSAALVLASACTGPDDDTDTDTDTDVSDGVVEGALALDGFGALAVIVEADGTSIGYLCGQGEFLDQTRWLAGDDTTLTGESVEVRLSGDQVEIDGPDGQTWSGALTAMDAGGLYQGFPDGYRTGLIAYEDEYGQMQTAGTFTDAIDFFQVEPVGTIVGKPDIVSVEVQTADETLSFDMNRLP